MDLNDAWQNHRRFILGVGAGLLVLIVGKVVIGTVWNADAAVGGATARLQKLNKADTVQKSELSAVLGATTKYGERLGELTERMRFKPDARYLLDKNDKTPDLRFTEIRSQATEALVDVAARGNIRVDESLGLPPFTPAGREAIQRYLLGLNVVQEVVESAILADVRAVDSIEIIDARGKKTKDKRQLAETLTVKFKISGTPSALSELVSLIVRDQEQFLSIEDANIEVDKKKANGFATMQLTVSALIFEADADEAGSRA
jgi:hypothetical protein